MQMGKHYLTFLQFYPSKHYDGDPKQRYFMVMSSAATSKTSFIVFDSLSGLSRRRTAKQLSSCVRRRRQHKKHQQERRRRAHLDT